MDEHELHEHECRVRRRARRVVVVRVVVLRLVRVPVAVLVLVRLPVAPELPMVPMVPVTVLVLCPVTVRPNVLWAPLLRIPFLAVSHSLLVLLIAPLSPDDLIVSIVVRSAPVLVPMSSVAPLVPVAVLLRLAPLDVLYPITVGALVLMVCPSVLRAPVLPMVPMLAPNVVAAVLVLSSA